VTEPVVPAADRHEQPIERVAFLGLGRMGMAMAERVARADGVLTVWNRNPGRADMLAERLATEAAVTVAASPRQAVSGATVIVSMLSDENALDAVLSGADGALAGVGPGAVWVEMSTIGPDAVATVAERLRAVGATLVDAPVSGSVDLARSGGLTVMAGGAGSDVERVRPTLDLMAATVLSCGPQGAGAALKLGVNLVVHALNAALSEALVLVERVGVPRATAFDLFTSSAVAAPFVSYKRAAFEDPESAPVAFSLDLVQKDLRLISALEHRLGCSAVVADALAGVVHDACSAGLGARDMSALAGYLRGDLTAGAPDDHVADHGNSSA
jgi:3-hydroxyisobutyrate dehydrogenase-like beta-hydroxyacid dehydrogenase